MNPPEAPSKTNTPSVQQTVEDVLNAHASTTYEREAKALLGVLIQKEQYVGEIYSLGYEKALVQIHDNFRQQVGGIPGVSFLIATRILPGADIDHKKEDSSVILLRVIDAAPLPNHSEALRIRTETAQRVTGEDGVFFDQSDVMDSLTANLLSFAGVECRIIGTFYLEEANIGSAKSLKLKFGSDISNYYPNRGLKVYKPNGEALRRIVNYRDSANGDGDSVDIGVVRYASTNRDFQGISDVSVEIIPGDLLGQKSALFGMTRIGKSNATKIILKSVFDLRYKKTLRRVGQIIFDPNGEYANENIQDNGALKNIWKRQDGKGLKDDVITYGTIRHPSDPDRKLMLLNFYELATLQQGKEIINNVISEQSAQYVKNFIQVTFGERPAERGGAQTRFDRCVLAYRALLAKASFPYQSSTRPLITGLFSSAFLEAMQNSQGNNAAEYREGALLLVGGSPTWSQLALAFQHIDAFIHDNATGYDTFNAAYMSKPNSSGDPWADEDFKKILRMFGYPNGSKLIGNAMPMHSSSVNSDYAVDIYAQLEKGKLVIVDQSGGDEVVNKASADRIMWKIFRENQRKFRAALIPDDILVCVEEAHNILPAGSDLDLTDVWVRTAKEGSKYQLGMLYITQEVSSIQKNILKNTANWFIGHLNNSDETKELVKYYDFDDFESSIRRAQDKGFLRVKTLSNLFVVPVQIKKFEV